jgi:hypothetical protein
MRVNGYSLLFRTASSRFFLMKRPKNRAVGLIIKDFEISIPYHANSHNPHSEN